MPIVETCAECGLDLHFVPGFKNGTGEYFHVFTSEKAGWYKRIHVPVPVIKDPINTDEFEVYRNTSAPDETFNSSGKVEPRASVMPSHLSPLKTLVF